MAITIGNTTSSRGPASEQTSMTFAHNSNTDFLVVTFQYFRPRTISSVTYAGVSMTQAVYSNGDYDSAIYYLVSPASGSNNVVVTLSGTSGFTGSAISLGGVDLTSPLGATNTAYTASTNAPSLSLTTTQANSIIIDGLYRNNGDTMTAGAGQTEFQDNTTQVFGTEGGGASYEMTTTTGSYAMSWSWTSANAVSHAAAEFKEAGGSPTNTTNFFLMM